MTENKKQTNTKQTKQEMKKEASKKQIVKKAKLDYKKLYEEAIKQNLELSTKVRTLIIDKNQDIETFKEKAKGFQEKAQVELNKVKEQLRLKAEQDEKEVKQYGSQRLLEGIIDPINNLDLAVKAGKKQENPGVQAYVQGFDMLLNQLFASFEDNGIQIITPNVGDRFDPELHLAISTNEGKDINIISDVKKKGYKLHDRVVLPASVIIGK